MDKVLLEICKMLEKDKRNFWNIILASSLAFFFGSIAAFVAEFSLVVKNGYDKGWIALTYLIVIMIVSLLIYCFMWRARSCALDFWRALIYIRLSNIY